MLSATLSPAKAAALKDKEGKSLDEWRRAAGISGPLDRVALPRGHYAAFIELHIEQGPLLERNGIALGVVTPIAAPASLRIWVEGEAGHAGAILIPYPHDPLSAPPQIVLPLDS